MTGENGEGKDCLSPFMSLTSRWGPTHLTGCKECKAVKFTKM